MIAARFHAFLLTTFLGFVTGCGSDSPGANASGDSAEAPSTSLSSVRDSAGVEIVEYPGALADLPVAFRIAETPTLDLGGSRQNPDQELDARAPWHDAVALSDGRLLVTDNSDYKVYSPTGSYVATIGRAGKGPGEFGQARSACVTAGDTIIAIHYSGPRVSVFDPNGSLLRDFRVDDGYPEGSGCFADGSLIAVKDSRPDPSDPAFRVATMTHVSSAGTLLATLGAIPYGGMSFYVPLSTNVVPHGEHIFVGDGRQPELRVYRRDGTLHRIVRWGGARVPVTDDFYTQLARATIPNNTPSDQVQTRIARALAEPHPSYLPAYTRIYVDASDRIWVEDYQLNEFPPVFPVPWTVFDPDGQPLGRVVLPAVSGVARFCPECTDARGRSLRIDLRSVGRDRVVLQWTDDQLGFVHLSLHALESVR